MNSPIRILEGIPENLFTLAHNEIQEINWQVMSYPDKRSENSAFKTCATIHLRDHKITENKPYTPAELSKIIECADTPKRRSFPSLNNLINWAYEKVDGSQLGKVMLVKLLPHGKIRPHIDLGEYFKFYYRFHVPLVTNSNVLFSGPTARTSAHMPAGQLCQLFNRNTHSVDNNSSLDRIHLIFDVSSENDKFNYDIVQDT